MYKRVWRVFSSVMVRGACVSAAACTHLWSALASNTIMFVLTLRALVGPLRFLRSDGAVPFLPGNTFNDPNVSTPLLLSDRSFANGGAVLRARCCCSLVIVLCVFQKTNFKKSHAFDYRSGTPIEFDVPAKEDAGGSPSRLQSRQSYAASERDNTRSQV